MAKAKKKSGKSKAAPRKKAATKKKAAKKPAPKAKASSKRAPARPKARPAARTRTAPRPPAPRPIVNPVREVARRIVELTVANDDANTFALYADNVESAEMGMPPTHGIQAIRDKFQMWRSMVSDATFRPRNVWVDGNTAVIEWAGRVTLAATGESRELNEIAIHEIENGKIVRERYYYNPAALQPSAGVSAPELQPGV